jgi:hypothetical protein
MDKEEFKNMANNPDFISGIYNYCDRWCERCAYTTNCFLFATEKRQFPDEESHDINNKEFWLQMEDMFRITFELLEDAAEELGIDLDEIDTEGEEQSEAEKNKRAEKHAAAKIAYDYTMEVNTWFEQSQALFEEKGYELAQMAQLDLPREDVSNRAAGIGDFVEIIRWYQHQIYVKIMRALRGQMDDFRLEEDPVQNDHNGSAKVALIGIERSIAAWGGLLKEFAEKEDSILHLLVKLEKIRKHAENEFPHFRGLMNSYL